MATRNLTMVVNKKHYKKGITPSDMTKYSKVNSRQDGSAVGAKLVFDHYYDSCYLYNNPDEIDHQYTYIIFYGDDPVIFCYDVWASREVFCYTPQKILDKYMDDMDYTDFAAGEIRNDRNTESNKVNLSKDNAQRLIDILTSSITD